MTKFAKMTVAQFAAQMTKKAAAAKAAYDAKVAAGFKLVPIHGAAGPAKWVVPKEGA